ncbi:uncharacterized protein LOC142193937 [Leptodactylus fuscus]|uniref:uncharacterized protein LOC142193937 n=1 Tax=Leptodactylus fuscus TaxID=238119 RepID=UPI003F4E6CCC
MSRKPSLPPQEDRLETMAVEKMRNSYAVGDCILHVEGTANVQVKIIYFAREGYLSGSLTAFLPQCTNFSIAAFFGLVARLLALPGNPRTPLMPETGTLLAYRRCLLSSRRSLPMTSMLYTGTNCVSPFFCWLQAWSKGLHSKDQAHSRGRDIINASCDLYSNLVKMFAGQTLHLSGMKCFIPHNVNLPKNQLIIRVSKNQDGKFKKCLEYKICKDPCLDTERSKPECIEIGDNSKTHMEIKQTTTGRQKRLRKVYKLAPTFQHRRILSETQISTWENSGEDGASDQHAQTDATLAMQNPLKHDVRKLIPDGCEDGLLKRETSHRAKDGIASNVGVFEDDLYPETSKHSDGHENSAVRSDTGFPPGAQSCPSLCLPEHFARQLVELFGHPGVKLDAFDPADFIVPLGYDLSRRIYLKWKTSLEVKYKIPPAK